jgi:PAS domain S-box-containing protein
MKPKPINKEVVWDKSQLILSKTDLKGNINFVNQIFLDVAGYTEQEVITKSHNIIRHPDMPKIIFKLLWERLKEGRNFHAAIKNMTKSGEYYWVVTDFDMIKNAKGEIIGYMGRRRAIDIDIVTKQIEPLYRKLLDLEKKAGVDASKKYLIRFLDDKKCTYVEYIKNIVNIPDFYGGIFRDL